jgi:hypothetical protein
VKNGWILILLLLGCLVPTPVAQENEQPRHGLQAIIFESYLTPLPVEEYDVIGLPSIEFPLKFSRLLAPFHKPASIQLPPGVVLPREPMFLDIYMFAVSGEQIQKNKRQSRHNPIQRIDYKIKFLSWSEDSYQVELDGRCGDTRFKEIPVKAAADKTTVVRIRQSESRVLYFALTPVEPEIKYPKDVTLPKPVTWPMPVYPSELLKTKWTGKVRIRAVVNKDGKIDPESFLLLECPHHLFARSSLDAILNQWTFQPAARNGVPLDLDGDIEVTFMIRR